MRSVTWRRGRGKYESMVMLRSPVIRALTATAAFAALAFCLFTPYYEGGDDVMAVMISSGTGFSDAPDEHLMHSNVLVGLPLKWLYTAMPRVPWYAGLLIGAVLLSVWAVLAALEMKIASATVRIIAAALCLGVFLGFLQLVTFTTAAVFAAVAGCLLFFAGGSPAASVSLVLLSSLLRPETAYLVLGVTLPMILWSVTRKRALLFLVTALALSAAADGANRAYYAASPEWQSFYADRSSLSELADYGRAPRERTLEYGLIPMFFFDPAIFSSETLRELPEGPRFDSRRTIRKLGAVFKDPAALCLIALAVFLPFLIPVPRSKLPGVAIALASVIGAIIVLAAWKKIPSRVYLPLLCLPALVALISSEDEQPARARLALCTLLLLFSGYGLKRHVQTNAGLAKNGAAFRDLVRKLEPRPDQLYVAWSEALPMKFFPATADLREELRGLKLLPTGIPLRTPIARRRMREFHIEDILRDSIGRRDVLHLIPSAYEGFVKELVKTRYGRDVAFRTVFSADDDHGVNYFSVFRLQGL